MTVIVMTEVDYMYFTLKQTIWWRTFMHSQNSAKLYNWNTEYRIRKRS